MGKSGESLRKLTRRFPAPDELEAMLSQLVKSDDRTIAIVGAAALEAIMERFIKQRLVVKDADTLNQLFENRGPCSDFNGKIVVARAAGYINEAVAHELQLVRHVRNAFAHAVVGLDFNTPEIAQRIAQSIVGNRLITLAELPIDEPRSRETFALVIRIIAIQLDVDHQEAGGEPLHHKVVPPVDLPHEEWTPLID